MAVGRIILVMFVICSCCSMLMSPNMFGIICGISRNASPANTPIARVPQVISELAIL